MLGLACVQFVRLAERQRATRGQPADVLRRNDPCARELFTVKRRALEEPRDLPAVQLVARHGPRKIAWAVTHKGRELMNSQSHALRGVLWMLCAVLSFAVMAVTVRGLPSPTWILPIPAGRTRVSVVLVASINSRRRFPPLRPPAFPRAAPPPVGG